MYELSVSNRKQLERATLRAQARKPKIEPVGYGMYKVWPTNPASPYQTYCTGIERAKDGNGYDVCCSCPTTRALCLHVSACFPHFLMTEKQEQTEPDPAGLVVQGVITTSMQEIENLIEQAKEASFEQDHEDIFGYNPEFCVTLGPLMSAQ